MQFDIDIVDNYTPPVGEITTDLDYVTFVMNMAAQSYGRQYNCTPLEGITAARAAYNAALPAVVVEETPTE
jgi:hypothetical protein